MIQTAAVAATPVGTAAGSYADPVLLSVLDGEPDTAADSDASAAGIVSSCPQTFLLGLQHLLDCQGLKT